ncbi:helix-turn-helix domain-containing protein [Candidatus Clostridium stratigraminis]|uniref:Helix-turn-helix domain-containing protein n=1 Tax=Candidatus Clostridium stratigraminis TaxID=3381661 RepID=A0ABW8T223_9CLOT
MEYKKFIELLQKGECKTIDYKIECNAFVKGKEKATAELVKDIIAFANNGNVASFLIIGVANDRNGFKSVENRNLTDDNLQTICRDYIFPIPKVKLIECCWDKVTDERHKDNKFVVIQIGPHARQCFRFNRDCINYDMKYCFKKSEVWIRREATSDLAIPEEIKRLLEGKEAISEEKLDNNVDYTRLPDHEYRRAIRKDLNWLIKELNGSIQDIPGTGKYKDIRWSILSINIRNQKLKILILIIDKCNEKGFIAKLCREIPVLHHGVILISVGNATASSVEHNYLKIKESWGWFCINSHTFVGKLINSFPDSQENKMKDKQTFCIVLEKVKSTQLLYERLLMAIKNLTEKEDIIAHTSEIYQTINNCLLDWRSSGCIMKTEKTISDYYIKKIAKGEEIKTLKTNEFIDIERYGKVVMKRVTGLYDTIDRFLE